MGTGIRRDSPLSTVPTSLISTICLLRIMSKNDERKSKFCEEITRKERVEFVIERINQYKDLVRTAKEIGSHLKRSAVTSWHNRVEDMVEWNERKGIRCMKWLNTMKRKLPKLQMNFTRSLAPRIG